jgi:hypothetical protein
MYTYMYTYIYIYVYIYIYINIYIYIGDSHTPGVPGKKFKLKTTIYQQHL